ncbi:Uncharacterised protein [Mycobacteroides abscessus subsp. abscessus]|nr:Uncharacterised protein [Mycobacteroides abscessus subsp. abscessus]
MKKHEFRFWLLAIVGLLGMVLSLSQPPKQVAAADNTLKSVFSIDAGRKYFSADQLKTIIDRAFYWATMHCDCYLMT